MLVHTLTSAYSHMQVLLSGYKEHYPPHDTEGILEFTRSLPSTRVYDALAQAKPVTKVISYAKTGNFRQQYDQVPPPEGLCIIGDAACYFNPVNVRHIASSAHNTHTGVCMFVTLSYFGCK